MNNWQDFVDSYIDSISGELTAIRRHIHANPELSGEEYETTQFLYRQLRLAGIPARVPSSGRGIIAESHGPTTTLRVAMRADIDALPLHDAKDVDYRSTHDGIAHACGHDAHATMLLGAALALHRCREHFPVPIPWRAIFQPAEETTRGAQEMIDEGAIDDTSSIIAIHVDPERAIGRVGVRVGVLTAASEEQHITIRGAGGHAARPHHTVDPIAIAIQFVNAVYQFIPRSVDSRHPVVVTFGMIRGGANANVIPEQVELQGTIRTLNRATAARVKERILTIGHGLSEASQAQIEIEFRFGTDPVTNDPTVTETCRAAAAHVLGSNQIEQIDLPSMGSEDFGAYAARVPGSMMRLGVAAGAHTSHFLHSPLFDIDEHALAIGAKILAHSAVQLAQSTTQPMMAEHMAAAAGRDEL